MTTAFVPALDPTPLPAPAWLFHILLLVTFVIHILFMNVTLGGTVMAAVHGLLARGADLRGKRLGRWMVAVLPASISFTITTGVAPLLFVQVLYGQFFYSATILVGWTWLALLVFLLVAYYAVYLHKYEADGAGLPGWLLSAAVCFLVIAGIQTLVNVLQLTPDRWIAIASRAESPLHDPTLIPRFLHFVLGSLAVAGMFLAVTSVAQANRTADPFLAWAARQGIHWALIATALQIGAGFWLLFALPRPILGALMGRQGTETVLFITGLALGILTLVLLFRIDEPQRQQGLVRGTAGILALTLFAMVGLRDVVRGLYLAAHIRLGSLPVQTQLDVLLLFVVTFVLGLATVAWMLRAVIRGRRKPA